VAFRAWQSPPLVNKPILLIIVPSISVSLANRRRRFRRLCGPYEPFCTHILMLGFNYIIFRGLTQQGICLARLDSSSICGKSQRKTRFMKGKMCKSIDKFSFVPYN
jgi:hypothetical protein